MKNTDLHNHSYYSDGQDSPKELIRLAKKRSIKNIALTDHNSVKGVKEAILEGKKTGINVIPGVEVRADNGEILGYFIDINNRELNKKLNQENKRLQISIKEWCNRLEKKGFNIHFSELEKKHPKARGNINTMCVLWELYLLGFGKTKEIPKKLKKLKLWRKGINRMSMVNAVKLVIKSNGIPVLAHPWVNDDVLKEKYFKKLVKAGLKGIEINNGDRPPFCSKKHKKRIKTLASRYNLVITSGSDFHGKDLVKQMPGNHNLGKNSCDEKVVEQLKSLLK